VGPFHRIRTSIHPGLNRQFNCRSFSKPECGTPFAPFLQIFAGVRHDDVRRSQHADTADKVSDGAVRLKQPTGQRLAAIGLC
jgi:hypothetical protein